MKPGAGRESKANKLAIGLALLIVPGVIFYLILDSRPKDPMEEMIRAGATARGSDPDKMVRVGALESKLRSGSMSEADWAELRSLARSEDDNLREVSYAILTTARGDDTRAEALRLSREMENDPSPKISAMHCWNLMALKAPDWRDVCQASLRSEDSERRRQAELAFKKDRQREAK